MMRNLIIAVLFLCVLSLMVPAAQAGGCNGFGVQSFGFSPFVVQSSPFVVRSNNVFVPSDAGRLEVRSFRGVFGARRDVIRNF